MRLFLFATVLMSMVVSAHAADLLAGGDPKVGKKLVDKSCKTCHVSMYGGDGSGIYTRPDRIIHNLSQLTARVRICNANAGANFFPEEETHVAAYLNLNYYHFKN